jgi:hypothetical protein
MALNSSNAVVSKAKPPQRRAFVHPRSLFSSLQLLSTPKVQPRDAEEANLVPRRQRKSRSGVAAMQHALFSDRLALVLPSRCRCGVMPFEGGGGEN